MSNSWKKIIKLLYSLILLLTLIYPFNYIKAEEENVKGWNYLKDKLIDYGVPKDSVYKVIFDKRFPEFTSIPFQVSPRESKASYKHFFRDKYINLAKKMLTEYEASFNLAQSVFRVDKHIIASILLIETQYGSYTGNQLTFYRLARIASVKDKENLKFNYERLKKSDDTVNYNEMLKRAQYLEETFLPEVVALFDLAKKQNNDVLSYKGSTAGAFGIPQFLPRSYLKFSVDGNNDEKKSLFNINDAIASTANFLAYYGWNNNLSDKEKEEIIWNYNRSNAYTSTVVEIAKILNNIEVSR